ncbi:PspA/IM30 family protein [Anaerobacillus isosaccharinicus]|uniref:Phage shock protein A n=1 Tax=Anaerobacillus isosaccharinicus TaxID=1532552 RepID=A0A1S2L514_9BACI|nr:PspA/IM30 family protein [Anaerobacillus isosaccharinicus]MBA5588744.1 PspA/IM30 family protein [Anaerobacillus isosaccharinicus]QOY37856.1 PspA/IM30 family protein [Anaerobacillus isosaccharinicus]
MFEFFKRIKTVVSSELYSMLEKAEDPEKMLDQFVREMGNEIKDVETATAKMIAEEKLFNKKVIDAKELVEKREQQALKALESGNEELARRALEDKVRVAKELEQLEQLHRNIALQAEDLKDKLKHMKSEFREMELKRETLKAKAGAAKAKTQMNRSLSSINNVGAKQGFERMEKKVMQFEAEAEASEDLRMANQSLDKELEGLDKENSIDLELARLKDKLKSE